MKQFTTEAIVLRRTNYGEADRILTIITPNYGKVRLLCKGVRKGKSKLAGGIELMTVDTLTYIQGKGNLATLTSSRLVQHFDYIVKDIERTLYLYSLLQIIDKITEDETERAYYDTLYHAQVALNDAGVNLLAIHFWVNLKLLYIGGHVPNLLTNSLGKPLQQATGYMFDFESMSFEESLAGSFTAAHIKVLRFAMASSGPEKLERIKQSLVLLPELVALSKSLLARNYSGIDKVA